MGPSVKYDCEKDETNTMNYAKPSTRLARFGLTGMICCLLTSVPILADSSKDAQPSDAPDCAILLHGLARTSSSMDDMQEELTNAGFAVAKIDYPSRTKPIEELAAPAIERGLAECRAQTTGKVHVVTHSMGGLLFRQYVSVNGANAFARTVMLAPPNKGSEAVDALRDVPGFKWLNGPAGLQMGTDENSAPLKLGPATSDVAIVAGTFSINIVLSSYLPDPDDGKVSVESTRLSGMCAHLQVDVSHPFIMEDEAVIAEVISYLNTGKFLNDKAEYPECAYRSEDKI